MASRFHRLVSRLAPLIVLLGACLQSFAQGPLLLREAFSRDYSIYVGGEEISSTKEIASREFSIFVGDEPSQPYHQVISRDFSLLITTTNPPARIKELVVDVSPTGDQALLQWCDYNEPLQRDVRRYLVYLSNTPFTSISNRSPYLVVPAGTCSITLSNLPPFQDRYFAVVAEDALGGYDSTVDYSAAYVLAPQAISREYSIFTGGETDPPFDQVLSRELSVLISTPAPPDRIADLVVTTSPIGDQATLDWSSYNELLQRDIIRYDIYLTQGPFKSVEGLSVLRSVPAGTSVVTLTNLTAYQDYYIAVVPVDAGGGYQREVNYSASYVVAPQAISREYSISVGNEPTSPQSQIISRELSILTPDVTIPDAVTGLGSSFEAVTSTATFSAIDASWPGYNEVKQRDVARYRIYVASSFFTDVTSMSPQEIIPAGISQHTIRGLFGGNIYYVAVVAEDVLGQFNPAVRSVSAKASISSLGDVRNLAVRSSSRSLSLTWSPPETVDAFLAGYHLFVGNSESPVSLPGTATTYEVTNLEPATGYSVRLTTVDTFGTESGGGSVLAATWLPNPTGVAAQSLDRRIRLQWHHAEPNDLVHHYAIYQSSSPITTVAGLQPILQTNTTRADIIGLANGTPLFFAVTTVNIINGQDPQVVSVSATPAPVVGQFADLELTGVELPTTAFRGERIKVTWTARNIGTGGTSTRSASPVTSWSDRIILSPDLVLGDADDILLATAPHSGALTPNGSYTGQAFVSVPTNALGSYFLFVQINADAQVFESLDTAANVLAPRPLTVLPAVGPSIAQQPTSLSTNAYALAKLSVLVDATPAANYQWRVNGLALAGQTNATLLLPNLQPWQAGNYDVVASNPVGSITSAVAKITVLPAANPSCVAPPAGLVAWWSADGHGSDLSGTNDGVQLNGASFQPGRSGRAFSFDGVNDSVRVPDSPSLHFGVGDVTAQVWIKAPRSTQPNAVIFYKESLSFPFEGIFFSFDSEGRISFAVSDCGTASCGWNSSRQGVLSPTPLNDDQWHHLVAVRLSTGYELYVDGALAATRDEPARNADSAGDLYIGAVYPGFSNVASYQFTGLIDELALFNRRLGSNEIASLYAAGPSGMCRPTTTQGRLFGEFADGTGHWSTLVNGGFERGDTSSWSGVTTRGSFQASTEQFLNGSWSAKAVPGSNFEGPGFSLNQSATVLPGRSYVLSGFFQTARLSSGALYLDLNDAPFEISPSVPIGIEGWQFVWQTIQIPAGVSQVTVRLVRDGKVIQSEPAFIDEVALTLTDEFVPPRVEAFAADLAVTALQSPANGRAGESIPLTFAITNQGAVLASGPWLNTVFLKQSSKPENVISVGTFTQLGTLGTNQSLVFTQTVILPSGAAGDWFAGLTLNSDSQIFESNRTNNTLFSATPIRIIAADLEPTITSAPQDAILGESIILNWSVSNRGTDTTTVSWNDRVLLSSSSNTIIGALSLGSVPAPRLLSSGASYNNSLSVPIPLNNQLLPGSYFLIVQTDHDSRQSESDESNNLAARPITLRYPARPDLVPVLLSGPSTTLPGQSTPLIWSITNQGAAFAPAGWRDSLYYSNAASGLQELVSLVHSNALASHTSISQTQSVTLPRTGPAGDVWWFVRVDSRDEVVEETEGNNALRSSSATQVPQTLNLGLSAAQVSENATAEIQVILTRNGDRSLPLDAQITVSSTNELRFPALGSPAAGALPGQGTYRVSFPANIATLVLTASPVQDHRVDPNQSVSLTAFASGFQSATAAITVLNADLPSLSVVAESGSVSEGQTLKLTVSRDVVSTNALPVAVASSSPSQLSPPEFVTIPGGAASVDFSILAVDDNKAEGPAVYSISVNAAGWNSGLVDVAVEDNDVPWLIVTLSTSSVPEGAGAQAVTMTVTRDPVGSGSLNIEPFSTDPLLAVTPIQITIPAGQASRSFPIVVKDDDGSVNEPRTLILDARALASSSGAPLQTISVPASLQVTDNDGPTLKVTVAQKLVQEGRSPATTATISRNTPPNQPLTVTLISDLPGEATLPTSVTLPVGQTSATVPVSTPLDGTPDGNKIVTLTASAAGYNPGSATLVVSDSDLPDLTVTEVQFPLSGTPQQRMRVSYRIVNQGIAALDASFLTRIYLSQDAVLGNDLLVAQTRHTNAIPIGGFLEAAEQIDLPLDVGAFRVIVETDAEQVVDETLEDNNVFVAPDPIVVAADYGAWVQVDSASFLPGVVVPMHGMATNALGAPLANREVSVHLTVRGTQRILSAKTDTAGNFLLSFQPIPGEGGSYELFATHPAVKLAAVQDRFAIIGMTAAPASSSFTLVEGESRDVRVTLRNLSEISLKGVAVEVISKPGDLEVVPSLPSTELLTELSLAIRFTATTANAYGTVQLKVRTTEGLTQDLFFGVSVEPLRPRLVATPPNLYAAMLVGGQSLVDFDLVNRGGKESGPITVSLPPVGWMHLVSTNPMPSLAPGATNKLTLLLSPPKNIDLTLQNGVIAINAPGAQVAVPFSFRAVSRSVGALTIEAVDEFTYYADGAPRVTNAVVTLRDPLSNTNVLTTPVNADGRILLEDLAEGYYDVQVSAEKHVSYRGTLLLKAGTTNELQTFLSRQVVTYNWTVEPVEIEDRYRVTIETVFETVVPVPVLLVEPSVIDLAEITAEESTVNLKITNKGLIAAQSGRISFGTHPRWEVRPLIEDLGSIPANTSITMPVRIRKLATATPAPPALASPMRPQLASGSDGPCSFSGAVYWSLLCGNRTNTYCSSVTLANSAKGCGGPGGGGIPPGYGGNSGPGNGSPLAPYVVGVSFSNPTVCDCSFLPKLCLSGEAKIEAKKFAEKLASALTRLMPQFLVKKTDVKLSLKGKLCTCCEDNQLSFEGNVTGAAEIGIVMAAGPGFYGSFPFDAGPEWSQERVTLDALLGVELSVTASAELKLEKKCLKDPRICATGSAKLGAFAGGKISGEIAAKRVVDGVNFSGKIAGQLGIEGTLEAKLEGCSDTGFKWEVCGQVFSRANISGTVKGKNPSNVEVSAEISLKGDTKLAEAGCSPPAPAPVDFLGVQPPPLPPPIVEEFDGTGILAEQDVRHELGLDQAGGGGVCAHVKLRLEQEAVIARDAFRGTLEIDNNGPARLENLGVDVHIRSESGESVDTNLFAIRLEGITALTAVDGNGILAGASSGSARWLIIPTVDAAPTVPTRFFVGGTLRYRQEGNDVSVPLAAVPVTVMPNPRLVLKYFHQRDVFSDDPFTPVIEPSVPYRLAVMVQNRGYGLAKKFHITSAQPQIVENEKGLLINFNIIATEIAGRSVSPSLTVDFGDIQPGDTAIGRWLLTSTLQGLFVDYKATWEHIDGLGNPRLSLIDEVTIHEMIHQVQATGAFEDGKPDFLVNEQPDRLDLPDTLYLSDGRTNHVEIITEASNDGPVTDQHLQVELNASLPNGWTYLRIPDPGNGHYRIKRVTRADGQEIAIGTNVWTTDRTFIGLSQRPVRENIMHLLEYNSPGRYTLVYEPGAGSIIDTNAPISQVLALEPQSRPYFQVSWSGQDQGSLGQPVSGIAYYNLFVSENGKPYQAWLTNSTLVSATYIGQVGSSYAFYSVATDANGNRELQPASPDTQTMVGITNHPPVLTLTNFVAINEGDTLNVPYTLIDPDNNQLTTVTSVGAVPPGLRVDSSISRIIWPTGEGNGPSTNVVTLLARDNDVDSLTATQQITIVIREVNSAPILAVIPDRLINEGQLLTVTNSAFDGDLPAQSLRYALGAGAPPNATLHPISGLFQWRPTQTQGGRTNTIKITVTDSGTPSLSSTQQFRVIVRDTQGDFVLGLGSTNLFAGDTNQIGIRLDTPVPLTSLHFSLPVDDTRLNAFRLTDLANNVASSSIVPGSSNTLFIAFTARSDEPFAQASTLAQLAFSARPEAGSGIVPLRFDAASAATLQGESLSNPRRALGRIVVVSDEPVLEAVATNASSWHLVLFGKPGSSYSIEQLSSLLSPRVWSPAGRVSLRSPYAEVEGLSSNNSSAFYRAVEIAGPTLTAELLTSKAGLVFDVGAVQPGKTYVLQSTTNFANWLNLRTNLSSSTHLSITNSLRPGVNFEFYRIEER